MQHKSNFKLINCNNLDSSSIHSSTISTCLCMNDSVATNIAWMSLPSTCLSSLWFSVPKKMLKYFGSTIVISSQQYWQNWTKVKLSKLGLSYLSLNIMSFCHWADKRSWTYEYMVITYSIVISGSNVLCIETNI